MTLRWEGSLRDLSAKSKNRPQLLRAFAAGGKASSTQVSPSYSLLQSSPSFPLISTSENGWLMTPRPFLGQWVMVPMWPTANAIRFAWEDFSVQEYGKHLFHDQHFLFFFFFIGTYISAKRGRSSARHVVDTAEPHTSTPLWIGRCGAHCGKRYSPPYARPGSTRSDSQLWAEIVFFSNRKREWDRGGQ